MDETSSNKDASSINGLSLEPIRISKSDERVSNSIIQKTNSFKSERDVTFAPSVDEHEKETATEGNFKNKTQAVAGCNAKGKLDRQESRASIGSKGSPKVPKKFITNWKQACDRTKDRTKELLKKWRTLPETETMGDVAVMVAPEAVPETKGWSVHVWSTWVNRNSVDQEGLDEDDEAVARPQIDLTCVQRQKFQHFFDHLLDTDRDDVISVQDVEHFIEKLRHFADWSPNSPEYNILLEVQQGFIDTFIGPSLTRYDGESELFLRADEDLLPGFISCDSWLMRWQLLTEMSKAMHDFPLWLQYFSKVLFHVINRSGSGIISRDELSAFYSSVLGLDTRTVGEIIDHAYKSMTVNGDYALTYSIYRLCFANYLLGKYPNGPGHWVLGPPATASHVGLFPIDYSALNADPGDLEHYTPDKKSNRRSVVV